ncbi:hypothetical protein [Novosphingobium sp.]|uniref:hypothetical protein n=1 Tax=Novosphingobium sp. TaxID=1874826 RepID=UPI0033406738
MRGIGGNSRKNGGFRRILRSPVISPMICAACVVVSALVAPTVVRAFASAGESPSVSLAARGALGSFTPASVDPRLVAQASMHALSHGRLFRFTPAGMENRPDRAVTVAIRLPDARGRMISSRVIPTEPGTGFAAMRIAPVAFNLGTARGYQSFALPANGPAGAPVGSAIHDMVRENAELRSFSLAAPAPVAGVGRSSRLEPTVAFDERAVPGRLPRTLGTQGDYQLNMGGSYRVMGNLDVTAGLRYSTDRDRIRPLTDHRQDSQAIYVGTQFHF